MAEPPDADPHGQSKPFGKAMARVGDGKPAYRRNGRGDLHYRGKLGAFPIHPRE
jgi:hypothetical protein